MTRAETFSYLPPLTDGELRAQIDRSSTARGLIPGIEYAESPTIRDSYWTLWKLPFVRPADPEAVLAELDQCAAAQSDRVDQAGGYDNDPPGTGGRLRRAPPGVDSPSMPRPIILGIVGDSGQR